MGMHMHRRPDHSQPLLSSAAWLRAGGLLACLALGCGTGASSAGSAGAMSSAGDDAGSQDGSGSAFDTDVALPLSTSCGGCHGAPSGQKGLVLSGISASTLKANLVNVMAVEAPQTLLVAPGQPDRSYLLSKLKGTQSQFSCGASCGSSMPPQGGFASENITAIEKWIAEGAQ